MLAPMAGYSDRPFREIAREWGADYAVAEMTASREDLRCRAKSLTRWVERDEPGLHVVHFLALILLLWRRRQRLRKMTAQM